MAAARVNSLRPGDVLRISVWPDATLGGEFTVEQSGNVYLPVVGEIRAVGMPVEDLRLHVREVYQTYLRDSVITITPAFTVGVMGQVQRPGLYIITPTANLFDVIGMAGGFAPEADESKVRVVREGEVIPIDAMRALRSGQGLDPLVLHSGDQIIVEGGGVGLEQMRNILALIQSIVLVATIVERVR
jgi:polysaccharide export outer membrane protein